MAVVGGIPLPPSLTKILILLGVGVLHVLEKRGEKRDISPIIQRGG
jgi:hypothetical protein